MNLRYPNVIAENELLQAAASIEAAAKKLSELTPQGKKVCRVCVVCVRACVCASVCGEGII